MPLSSFAQHQQLAYRELLRKLRSQAARDNDAAPSSSVGVFEAAQARVRAHMRAGKEAGLNPRRAFARVRAKLNQAQTTLQELESLRVDRTERLRQVYDNVKQRGLAAVAQKKSAGEEAALVGKDSIFRALVLGVFGGAAKGFMRALSATTVEGREILEAALARQAGQPLITVSNHVASLDDPLVLAALTPAEALLDSRSIRWTLCATDRCFKHAALVPFFRAAKVLPVERGAGMSQPGMRAAEARLSAGDWVHIFPEGTRTRDGNLGPLRRGIGRLVAACERTPLVVPFVHSGMDKVNSRGSVLPKVGQHVQILVGEPVVVEDLMEAAKTEGWGDVRLYTAITDRVSRSLHVLKARLEGRDIAQPPAFEKSLQPVLQDEIDSMTQPWGRNVVESCGIGPLVSRTHVSRINQGAAFCGAAQGAAGAERQENGSFRAFPAWSNMSTYSMDRMAHMCNIVGAIGLKSAAIA